MRSLLVLYMVNHLFIRPDVGARVLGFNAISARVRVGCSTPAWRPSRCRRWVYGLYTGFVYLTPFFGGLLADRLLGRRKAVIVGGIAHGHRPLPDGDARTCSSSPLMCPDPRQRLLQAQHLDAGRRPLPAGRPAARPRVLDLLRRHQHRRVPGAAHLRHARPEGRLALRLRRRRRRHGAGADLLPHEPEVPAVEPPPTRRRLRRWPASARSSSASRSHPAPAVPAHAAAPVTFTLAAVVAISVTWIARLPPTSGRASSRSASPASSSPRSGRCTSSRATRCSSGPTRTRAGRRSSASRSPRRGTRRSTRS